MTIAAPASEREVADTIRGAHDASTPVEIVGGGTKRGIGRLVNAGLTLSTRGLAGITSYNPAEMVMTARAGTPLAEIEAALGANRQRLAFEPPDHRGMLASEGKPTIGAVAAANLSGPRRIVAGAARDSLLGIRMVNGEGELVSSGGRVMKNVTGLDLVKLVAGSWGTLGVLTEVTFKVLPVPETEATVAVRGLHDDAASNVMAHAMATSAEVSGAAHLPEPVAGMVGGGSIGSEPATLLRLEGFVDSVRIRAEKLKSLLAGAGDLQMLDEPASRAVWRDIRDVTPFAGRDARPVWRISVKPSAGHELALALRREAPATAFFDWQGGLVWARLEGDPDGKTVRGLVRAHGGGHATLWRASPAQRAATMPFEPLAPALAALSARIKAAFDPKGILNPGRLGI
jgi:glycolate oxidase FAD binding subunit